MRTLPASPQPLPPPAPTPSLSQAMRTADWQAWQVLSANLPLRFTAQLSCCNKSLQPVLRTLWRPCWQQATQLLLQAPSQPLPCAMLNRLWQRLEAVVTAPHASETPRWDAPPLPPSLMQQSASYSAAESPTWLTQQLQSLQTAPCLKLYEQHLVALYFHLGPDLLLQAPRVFAAVLRDTTPLQRAALHSRQCVVCLMTLLCYLAPRLPQAALHGKLVQLGAALLQLQIMPCALDAYKLAQSFTALSASSLTALQGVFFPTTSAAPPAPLLHAWQNVFLSHCGAQLPRQNAPPLLAYMVQHQQLFWENSALQAFFAPLSATEVLAGLASRQPAHGLHFPHSAGLLFFCLSKIPTHHWPALALPQWQCILQMALPNDAGCKLARKLPTARHQALLDAALHRFNDSRATAAVRQPALAQLRYLGGACSAVQAAQVASCLVTAWSSSPRLVTDLQQCLTAIDLLALLFAKLPQPTPLRAGILAILSDKATLLHDFHRYIYSPANRQTRHNYAIFMRLCEAFSRIAPALTPPEVCLAWQALLQQALDLAMLTSANFLNAQQILSNAGCFKKALQALGSRLDAASFAQAQSFAEQLCRAKMAYQRQLGFRVHSSLAAKYPLATLLAVRRAYAQQQASDSVRLGSFAELDKALEEHLLRRLTAPALQAFLQQQDLVVAAPTTGLAKAPHCA